MLLDLLVKKDFAKLEARLEEVKALYKKTLRAYLLVDFKQRLP